MKQFLLLTFFSFITLTAFAQSFTVEPNPAILEDENVDLSNMNAEPINHATLTNMTSGTVSLRWERTILSAPAEWEFPVCDKNTCYFPINDEPLDPIELEADATSLLDVHVRPNGVSGCATVELKVTPFSNPDNVLTTAIYEFKINNPGECLTSVNNTAITKVRIYPNPTADLFKIAELDRIPEADEVAVFNVLGKQVKSFNPSAGQFSVGDLPDGLYLVSLLSNENGILKTVRMNKNTPRP